MASSSCTVAYKAEKCRQIIINNLYEDYAKGNEYAKMVRDEYYHWVYYSGFKTNGYMSNDVFMNKTSTDDHYMSPRMVISAIIENNIHILYDKELFCDAFNLCRDVVRVTRAQNNEVKFINKNNEKVINELTINKYDKYGPWWQVNSQKKILSKSEEFPLKKNIPEWFTEYEKRFLVNR